MRKDRGPEEGDMGGDVARSRIFYRCGKRVVDWGRWSFNSLVSHGMSEC